MDFRFIGHAVFSITIAVFSFASPVRAEMGYDGGFVIHHATPWNPNELKQQTARDQKRHQAPDYGARVPSDYYYPEQRRDTAPPTIETPSAQPSNTFGLEPADFPWNRPGVQGYSERQLEATDGALGSPSKYSIKVSPIDKPLAPGAHRAVLAVHLPGNSPLWVDGHLTRQAGEVRYFTTPPLKPAEDYSYRFRTMWVEDGKWVSAVKTVKFKAGEIQGIYLEAVPTK